MSRATPPSQEDQIVREEGAAVALVGAGLMEMNDDL